jgi:hypothetical protein
MAKNLVLFRDKLFKDLKKGSGRDVIDLTKYTSNRYDTFNGIMSYCASVNDPRYTISDIADEVFSDIKDRYMGVTNVHILFPGVSFLESHLPECLSYYDKSFMEHKKPRVTLYDASQAALYFYYLLSDNPFHDYKQEKFNPDRFYSRLNDKSLIISHNGIHTQDIKKVFEDAKQLGSVPQTKLFCTLPTTYDSDMAEYYGSPDCHFRKNFVKESLLHEGKGIVFFCDRIPLPNGFVYESGFRTLDSPVLFHNQYFNDSTTLRPNTTVLMDKSYRYDYETSLRIAEMAKADLIISKNKKFDFLLR